MTTANITAANIKIFPNTPRNIPSSWGYTRPAFWKIDISGLSIAGQVHDAHKAISDSINHAATKTEIDAEVDRMSGIAVDIRKDGREEGYFIFTFSDESELVVYVRPDLGYFGSWVKTTEMQRTEWYAYMKRAFKAGYADAGGDPRTGDWPWDRTDEVFVFAGETCYFQWGRQYRKSLAETSVLVDHRATALPVAGRN